MRPLFVALTATLLSLSTAQAAEIRIGAHYEPLLSLFIDEYATAPNQHEPLTTYSIDVSVTTTPEYGPKWRSTLGLGLMADYPMARLDIDLLSRGNWYYGAGIGTGTYKDSQPGAPNLGQSMLIMTNVHGLLGANFGPVQLEGFVRLGLVCGGGLSINTRLN